MSKLWLWLPLILFSCSSVYQNRDPLNEMFPEVKGRNLENVEKVMPQFFAGRYVVILIGYKQNSQFDIDRWLLGLTDSQVDIELYELPAVVGMVPGMISGKIDDGMRSGIPKPLWTSVITLYNDDADRLARLTGNKRGLNARVLLLDPQGRIRFFHDQGYGIPYLKELLKVLREARESNRSPKID